MFQSVAYSGKWDHAHVYISPSAKPSSRYTKFSYRYKFLNPLTIHTNNNNKLIFTYWEIYLRKKNLINMSDWLGYVDMWATYTTAYYNYNYNYFTLSHDHIIIISVLVFNCFFYQSIYCYYFTWNFFPLKKTFSLCHEIPRYRLRVKLLLKFIFIVIISFNFYYLISIIFNFIFKLCSIYLHDNNFFYHSIFLLKKIICWVNGWIFLTNYFNVKIWMVINAIYLQLKKENNNEKKSIFFE